MPPNLNDHRFFLMSSLQKTSMFIIWAWLKWQSKGRDVEMQNEGWNKKIHLKIGIESHMRWFGHMQTRREWCNNVEWFGSSQKNENGRGRPIITLIEINFFF